MSDADVSGSLASEAGSEASVVSEAASEVAPVDARRTGAGPAAAAEPAPSDALDSGDLSLLGLVDRLAAVLERSDLLELEVQAGSTALVLRRPEALAAVVIGQGQLAAAATGAAAASGSGAADHAGETAEAARASVKAPLTGIWYSAPAPGTAPFVQVGGEVAVGQVIGLIEAMKLFNEIKSDLAGRVVRVAAENGQLVKAKQPLIEVEPL